MTAALILVSMDVPAQSGFRPTKMVNGISSLQRLVITFRLAGIETILAITPQRMDISQHLARMQVFCIGSEISLDINHMDYMEQAVAFLEGKCKSVLLAKPEVSLFSPDTVRELLSCAQQPAAQLPAAPEYKGEPGLPLLVSLQALTGIVKEQKRVTAEEMLAGFLKRAVKIPMEDPSGALRLDQVAAWQKEMEKWRVNELRPVLKCTIAREYVFLGPGSRQLLWAIEEMGSVRNACVQIGLSYSKGRRMILRLEQQIGMEVVTRQKGGKEGGNSHLAPLGRDLLNRYTSFENECMEAMQPIFYKYFVEGAQREGQPM